MRLYNENNTNTLLTVTNPDWVSLQSPAQATPQGLEIPGGPNETWLTGMAYDEVHGIVYAGSNIGGFYMWFQ